MDEANLLLLKAIQTWNVRGVKDALKQGADPNKAVKISAGHFTRRFSPLSLLGYLFEEFGKKIIAKPKKFKKILVILLENGATHCPCKYNSFPEDFLPMITSSFAFEFEKNNQDDVLDMYDFLVSTLLPFGFNPNSNVPTISQITIDCFAEIDDIDFILTGKARSKFLKIFQDLLRYGSDLPKYYLENYKRVRKLLFYWPMLQLIYCANYKNTFLIF